MSIINSDLSGHNSPRGLVPGGGRVEGTEFRNSPNNLDTFSWGGWSEPLGVWVKPCMLQKIGCFPQNSSPKQFLGFPLFCFYLHLSMSDIFALKIHSSLSSKLPHTHPFFVASNRRKLIWKNKCQSCWCLCENRSRQLSEAGRAASSVNYGFKES